MCQRLKVLLKKNPQLGAGQATSELMSTVPPALDQNTVSLSEHELAPEGPALERSITPQDVADSEPPVPWNSECAIMPCCGEWQNAGANVTVGRSTTQIVR